MNSDTLIIILSVGFIILIVFACAALGTMIKIMLDIKKITEIARHEAEEIGEIVDSIGERFKSYFTNSFIMDKIIPAILGSITVGMSAKSMASKCAPKKKAGKVKTRKGRKYILDGDDIFVREEID